MDFQERVKRKWAARMASSSAFTFESSGKGDLAEQASLSSSDALTHKLAPSSVEGQGDACEDPRIHCRRKIFTDKSKASTSPKKTREPTVPKCDGFCIMDFEARVRDKWGAKMSSALPFTPILTASNNSADSDAGIENRSSTTSSTREIDNSIPSQGAEGIGVRQHDQRFCPTSSGCDAKQDNGFQATYNSESKNTGSINDGTAPNTKYKTSFPNPYSQASPCVDPRFHCRPKTFTETPKASCTKPQKKESSNTFKCDDKFECEIWLEGEASAKPAWTNCRKNPGHGKFYPVKEFSLDKLPQEYRSRTYRKGIKSVADLTVRIKVKYNSEGRPDDDAYARYRGTKLPRTGSGFISARLFTNKITDMEFPDNFTSDAEEDFGLQEELSAKYDRKFHESSLKYYLENLLLPFLPESKKEKFQHVLTIFSKIARGIKGFFDCVADHNYLYAGGEFGGKFDDDDDLNNLYHNELVQLLLRLNLKDTSTLVKCLPGRFHKSVPGQIVSGICKIKDLNFGPFHRPRKPPKNKCQKAYRLLHRLRKRERIIDGINTIFGKFPQEAARNGEYVYFCCDDKDKNDTDDHFNKCQDSEAKGKWVKRGKTYAHVDDEQDYDQSDETDDDDDIEEDWKYSSNDLFEIVRPCPCHTCKNSEYPERTGYSINVLTARHVVFDRKEAQQTVVDLFCDDETENGMEQLHGVNVHVASNSGDFSILMCATHDKDLIKRLRKMLVKMTATVKKMKAQSNMPLAVLCSHPHGNFKHITVGEWTTRKIFRRRDGLPPLWTSYLYNTPTCPGSSGAPVLVLGHKSGTLSLDSVLHPHHGYEESTLNKSSRLVSFYSDLDDMSPEIKQRVLEEQEEVYRQIMEEVEKRLKEEAKKFRKSAETAEKLAKSLGILDLLKKMLSCYSK